MADLHSFLNLLHDNWQKLKATGTIGLSLLLIVPFLTWLVASHWYETQISNYKSESANIKSQADNCQAENSGLKERVAALSNKQAVTQPPLAWWPESIGNPLAMYDGNTAGCSNIYIGESNLSGGKIGYDVAGCVNLSVGSSKMKDVQKAYQFHSGKND